MWGREVGLKQPTPFHQLKVFIMYIRWDSSRRKFSFVIYLSTKHGDGTEAEQTITSRLLEAYLI